jgi:prepilin-type processing-associated H-X9-DG protein
MFAARGRHTGGVMVGMCDGSVRFVRNSININTWRYMSTSTGGEVYVDN